jgi:hypothetical protein
MAAVLVVFLHTLSLPDSHRCRDRLTVSLHTGFRGRDIEHSTQNTSLPLLPITMDSRVSGVMVWVDVLRKQK